jgi:hypothetical protein
MKVLQVIDTAYRCTVEEQDDPVVWITHAMKGAGGDLSLLLRGNAVNYAVKGQDASGLAFGDRKQSQPPHLDRDVQKLTEKGVAVYLVQEDAAERGIEPGELVDGIERIARSSVGALFGQFDHIWHW